MRADTVMTSVVHQGAMSGTGSKMPIRLGGTRTPQLAHDDVGIPLGLLLAEIMGQLVPSTQVLLDAVG